MVWTVAAWRVVAGTNMHSLTTRYDPKGDPSYQAYRTYDDLYRLTKHIAKQHNDFAARFLCTLGSSFLGVGVILLVWSIDRERLCRRIKGRERQ